MAPIDREARLVEPFYLKLVKYNATWVGHEVWDEAVEAGRGASYADVVWLLERREWRPMMMGAWFSLGRPEPEVAAKVVEALSFSSGSFTAPPLAVAAAILAGRSAEHVLRTSPVRSDDLSRIALDAALEWLELVPVAPVATSDAENFTELANFGLRFRTALLA